MERTNIVLDEKLVRRAMKVTGERTKRQVVDIALRRLVDQAGSYSALLRGAVVIRGEAASVDGRAGLWSARSLPAATGGVPC